MVYRFTDVVIDSRTGLNPRKNFVLGGGDNYYITIKDIYNGKVNLTDKTDKVDDEAIQIIKRRSRIKAGDVLFVSIGRIGETAIVTNKDDSWDVNESVFVFTLNDKIITPEYFCTMFQSQGVKQYLSGNSSGSTFKSIKMNQLERMTFDLPPVTTQKSITTKLTAVRRIIDLRTSQLAELNNLVKARFVELFGDPLTNPKGYQEKYLSEIAEYWNGLTYKPDDVANEGTIVLRSSNIQNASLDFADTVRVNCKIGTKKYVQDNDILMCSRNGSAKLVGKVALIKELSEPMSFGAFMMIIRSAYYPFLMTYFQLPAFRSQITTGATTTINQITGRMLDNVKLAIPDIESAKDFSAFTNQVDKSKVAVQKSLDEAQLLFDSLMQQYFG